MVSFSHSQRGTSAREWVEHGLGEITPLEPDDLFAHTERLLVLVAHPDDETLGAGGLINLALRRGIHVQVLLCSFGERSHPDSPTHSVAMLTERRKTEMVHAMDALQSSAPGPGSLDIKFGNFPDGMLSEYVDQIEIVLRSTLGDGGCVVASTYRDDGHPDHEILAILAGRLASEHGLWHLEFPIWYWHWAEPEHDTRWKHWQRLPLDRTAAKAKHRAIGSHTSQIEPLSAQPGDEAILPAHIREHFLAGQEFFRCTRPGQRDAQSASTVFEHLYRQRPDPWDYRSSDYERRKQQILLACLPAAQYARTLELGCSIGVQSAALAQRSAELVAVDASERALHQARQEVGPNELVRFEHAVIPRQWPTLPAESVDLVVFSEIGYFLAADELAQVFDKISQTLQPGGHLALCHWLHPIEGWPLDGRDVHIVAEELGWDRLVIHEEKDFMVEILAKPGGQQ